MSSGQSLLSSHRDSTNQKQVFYTIQEAEKLVPFTTLLLWSDSNLKFPYLSAGLVSSPDMCSKTSWRSRCHCKVKKKTQQRQDKPSGVGKNGNVPLWILLHWPSNVPLLVADVFVVMGVLHDLRNIHNQVHKRLCLLAKEVQQVSQAAVLCDHKHWSWGGNTPCYHSSGKTDACMSWWFLAQTDGLPPFTFILWSLSNGADFRLPANLRRCRLLVSWQCSDGGPGDSGSSAQTSEPPSHRSERWLQTDNILHYLCVQTISHWVK